MFTYFKSKGWAWAAPREALRKNIDCLPGGEQSEPTGSK